MTADIRILNIDQIETLIDWAAAEGWNPGLDDARRFQLADPNGFLGAFVDGRMVAGISVVAYSNQFGFLGLYICHPDFRGQGYGRAVWNAGMAYLGDRTIGLDGVPQQQASYRKMGFVTEYETVRMVGALDLVSARHVSVAPILAASVVRDVDLACFPSERQSFLEAWIAPPHQAWFSTRDGAVTGYVVVRECRTARKVGPLFAHDLETAMTLLGTVEGEVQIDVPMHQVALLAKLKERGFDGQFNTARMYRGAAPDVRLDRVFAVSTLELG
ncbi:GNAT family N-acetyltransferase [Devosia sp. XJ19-1]|uniref:GNAT family N-acetyltransferase n=1 Tax=Devosia ureilytica TaxID=2952754 RepID=A0A9Q4FR89_9HYPH|nr:GNAT family N-acetyltransferase [Devosia ureilytica]MCP8882147.1 GNAT family N-acetyltransferase [Devosia ureilytica]MCP8885967.1 GNAT family N-acetyltransferase [Devosia ureilytica]